MEKRVASFASFTQARIKITCVILLHFVNFNRKFRAVAGWVSRGVHTRLGLPCGVDSTQK